MKMMTAALNPSHATLFLLLIFFFRVSQCAKKPTISCPDIEKQSLLNFKQSLEDPDNALSSWEDEVNCCKWKGVVCSNLTGHVHQLRLQEEYLSGKIDPSLVNLKHLRYLDLSLTKFAQTIPSFIGSFTNLEYLNLSYAGFHGKIPHTLGNLSHLHTLDLAENPNELFVYSFNKLSGDRFEWLSGLPKLEYLNMNYADLNRATDWAQVINTLPSLLQLHFQSCSLEYVASLGDVINITALRFLDFSYNYNQFKLLPAPAWIFQLTNLVSLDLSYNHLTGPIPSISNATKLQYIDLSHNSFNYSSIPDWLFSCRDLQYLCFGGSREMNTSTIPKGIGNLTSLNDLDLSDGRFSGEIPGEISKLRKLKRLDFSANELHGEIADYFGKMFVCFSQTLEVLSLDGNDFSGQLPVDFGEIFKNLRSLGLSGNSLSGAIPTSLGKLSSLESLFLNGNKFTGNLPENFGQLSNLNELWIGDNMLEGIVSEAHFANLTKLELLYASGNHLTLKVAANWIPPFQIRYLDLGSWNLGPSSKILSWLEAQEDVFLLDLSDTGISGNIPLWILDSGFEYLNLSHNHLHGNIPHIGGARRTYLSSNKFSGALPLSTGSIQELDLSDNSFSGGLSHFLCNDMSLTNELTILHLGGNELDGELPDCWMKCSSLQYLNLGNNNMHGSIPTSLGYLPHLLSLNLYGNKFSGQIPFSMHNCSQLLKNIDLSNNHLSGSIPTWMGANLFGLQFLILRSNKLSGEIPSEICYLNYLQILDLSENKISGIIPSCVNNFTAMTTDIYFHLRASYSLWGGMLIESASIATKGLELQYDTILYLVTGIDLSGNNLSGEIPKELTSLVELRSLNLSQNHLTGSIPEKIGDMRQLESLDFSRNSLSGQIPSSITLISSLSYLNLSYNNFTGKIPEGTQLQGLNASSFIWNNLCGPPLSNCSHDSDQVSGHNDEDGESDESHEIEWLYVFISSGYAVGVSIVVSVLVLNKSWREAYFELLKSMWDKLYVFACVHWRRLIKLPSTSS